MFLMILLFLPLAGNTQEVVVNGFPVGTAGSIDDSFFEPYFPQLQMIADTLKQYPLLHAIVMGSADGETYRANNDAQNPGLALGRAHVLRAILISKFGVDSTQLVVQTEEADAKGAEYRYASVRVVWQLNDFKARLDNLADREPIIQQPITQVTEVREVNRDLAENMGIQLGAGFSSSPFGGIPVVSGALVWEDRIYIEGLLGHNFWNGSFDISAQTLDTRRRLAGGSISYFPFENIRVGVLAGWIRVEELAERYYEYVKMSEGPYFGLTWYPVEFASVTGAYNPARQRIIGDPVEEHWSDEFMLLIRFHLQFGGKK
jgi:hypothetical protein